MNAASVPEYSLVRYIGAGVIFRIGMHIDPCHVVVDDRMKHVRLAGHEAVNLSNPLWTGQRSNGPTTLFSQGASSWHFPNIAVLYPFSRRVSEAA